MRIPIAAALLVGAIACRSDVTSLSANAPSPKAIVISAAAASQHQQETALAQFGSRIVAVWIGWMSGELTTIEYAISDDAGATWGAPAEIPIPSPSFALSDPGIVADDAGNFTLVALGVGVHEGVYAFRLAAGATTFGAPVIVDRIEAFANFFDKTLIARTGSGYLVTYSVVGTAAAGIAATSSDGVTWQRDTIATNGPTFIVPCASGQSVFAAYLRNSSGGGLYTTTSADGGRTWSQPTELDSAASRSTVPACARRGDEIWVLAGTGSSGLHLFRSTSGGRSFTSFHAVPPSAVFGQLSIRNDGTLDIGYYESSAQIPFGFVHALLPPGATAFQPRQIVRDQMHVATDRYGIQGYADYVGMIPGGIVFTDNSSGVSHIAFFKESVP